MLVSSIGYYRVFTLNLRDSHIFILDPTTTGIVDKEDWMKRFSRALKQIEENIATVVRLKHSNYEGKMWQYCITDNIPSTSR
jgi:succinyl-CoA synthetase beta subunit